MQPVRAHASAHRPVEAGDLQPLPARQQDDLPVGEQLRTEDAVRAPGQQRGREDFGQHAEVGRAGAAAYADLRIVHHSVTVVHSGGIE